ncbi:Lrp/AsnC family transcriptional regulator [Cesiribacter andamanensis]|uniref:Regulatory protein AsnC n=1 Tax=Cesiribacter andamanensis AMV16 TaxID=1279009 RepID=M7NZW4_9BACT|nr:Lrp/AsnC ligand binding domain-containing protein [Cesiribacter andamanensis]EMR03904.1 Regulatory protein AsnC [Cesiribacter andamanensis AMV16]
MSKNYEIDTIDLKILALLSEDAKIPYTEIAKKVFVSGGTVHVRMRKLEEMGVVQGATLKIDYSKLGYDITAFLGIFLEKSSYYERVASELEKIPEVVSLHYTTGPYSMYCRIYCKDTTHLRQVLHDKIQKIDGVERTESIISLEERVQRTIRLDELME